MKQKTKFIAALALVCAVVLGVAAAAGTSRQITATLRPDITVQVDGVNQAITDSNGNEAAPIIYNGTTYLPVKSIGQILGQSVTWDGKTNTVNITNPNTPSTPVSTPSSADLIGEAEAKEIALNHAKLSASDVTFIQSKLDWENGRRVYDVEFYSGSKEYDYEIDAKTGEILSYDYDAEHYTPPQSGSNSGTLIGPEKAKEIALKHAGVSASDATFVRSKLDWDDGRQIYEVEFYSGNDEYDYEIDAYTGGILSYDRDAEGYTPSAPSTEPDYITQEQAKKLAQDRAPKATLVAFEFDYDDGRAVYEGELREGRTEYEFKIDAQSGQFLEWEADYD